MRDLELSVIRILNTQDKTIGTGFVVANDLAVTCAHVVKAAGSACNQPIHIEFYHGESKQTAHVLATGWSLPNADDVAFLKLESLPQGIVPVVLGSAKECEGHPYHTFGFAFLAGYDNRHVNDTLDGVVSVRDKHKRPMLQLKGEEIGQGLSGSPVLDTQTNRVVGMVSEYKDNERTRFAWATIADTLAELNPSLRLWPNSYGPEELNLYLDYLIDNNQILALPDGREVLLERVYVSLRADEMNAAERSAEHDLYLEDVALLKQPAQRVASDRYAEFTAMRKVVARHPKMLMLDARNWPRLFGKREHSLCSLAEVVRRHPHVVLLGDPGSGKTTLGKWLVLQFARTLRQGRSRIEVRADWVQPGAEVDKLVDLGSVRLPILIRIADYVRVRWDKEQGDIRIPLERFLASHQNLKHLPIGLRPAAIEALLQDYLATGQALVVLDGLDEVGDPDQRMEVMQQVRKLIYGQPSMPRITETTRNRVVITSRIVGYQFQPLIDLPHYTVEDMDETAIATFCRAWMMHVAGVEEAAEEAQKLKDSIFDHTHPGVRSLAGNPLLLTILAQVYWTNTERTLPTRRVALFDAALKAMYDQRKEFWDRVNIPSLRLTRALGAVAIHIHANESTGFAEEGMVREQLETVLLDKEQVEAVLEVAREVSGFLVARGEGVYGFLHRSVQEYFVAQHLVDQPSDVATRLVKRFLDTNWREPITLAVAIVSRRRYPNSIQHLTEVFDALFNAPDPAGDFLPRRELLAVACCVECERVPPVTGAIRRIIENLLSVYVKHGGPDKSIVLSTRVHEAIIVLRNTEMREQVEALLCETLQASDFEYRKAIVSIISETSWDSPSIARTLVKVLSTHAGPAALLLTTLDEMFKRHPDYFQQNFLPLRRAVMVESVLWENALATREWRAIIRMFYLSLDAEFKPELINRDSPLTPQLLNALRQSSSADAWANLLLNFESLAGQPGTAIARDAALALSCLGDRSWVSISVANADSQGSEICSIMSYLVLILNYALLLDLEGVYDIARSRGLSINNAYELVLYLAHDIALPLNLIDLNKQERNSPRFSSTDPFHIIDLEHTLSYANLHAKNLADNPYSREYHSHTIVQQLKEATIITKALDFNPSHAFVRDIDEAISHSLELIEARSLMGHLSNVAGDARRARDTDLLLGIHDQQHTNFRHIRKLAYIVANTIDKALEDIQDYVGSAYSLVNIQRLRNLNNNLSDNLVGDLHLVFDLIPSSDYISSHTRDFDLVYARDFDLAFKLASVNARIDQVKRVIETAQFGTRTPTHLATIFTAALDSLHTLESMIAISSQIAQVLTTLVIECRKRWPSKVQSPVDLPKHNELTTNTLVDVTAQLTSPDDVTRERAQVVLAAKHLASELGQPVIEQIAELSHTYVGNPLVNNQLTWALQEIIHDAPSWIIQWSKQIETSQNKTSAEIILGAIHRILPETLETVLSILPNASACVNIALLRSLSWLARLGRLPKGTLPGARTQLLTWLDQESDPSIRRSIIDVLGHWPENSDFAIRSLRNLLKRSVLDSDRSILFKSLARLAIRRPLLAAAVRDSLYSLYMQPGAAAALVRLNLTQVNKRTTLRNLLAKSDPHHYLTTLLDAGSDDDLWRDEYHGFLTKAICAHLEGYANLLPVLLASLQQALEEQNWPAHRIALAAVAACTEVMPIAVQRAYQGNLEALLIKGTSNVESFNSRRFALTALSYLSTITSATVPVLLAGCQDTESVQRDTIIAASRFQSIEGNPLPLLLSFLTGESVSTAYVVAQLLGALGASAAGETVDLREAVIEALVNALKDPGSQREIVISGMSKGKLEDALYTALLQVAGWLVG